MVRMAVRHLPFLEVLNFEVDYQSNKRNELDSTYPCYHWHRIMFSSACFKYSFWYTAE